MDELRHEVEVMHLLYYRNRNQFKSAIWWKQFAMLHRWCARYLQKQDPDIAQFVVKKLVPSAHRAFHGLVAQGQFITIGFALIGLTAKIRSILLPLVPKRDATEHKVTGQPSAQDIGQAVSRDELLQSLPVKRAASSPPPAETKKKSKKKSKKKRSAIDDIFGGI